MSAPFNWKSANEDRRKEHRVAWASAQDKDALPNVLNRGQQKDIRDMLDAEPEMPAGMRRTLEKILAYLLAHPARTLSSRYLLLLKNYATACNMAQRRRADGKEAWPPLPADYKRRTRTIYAKHARQPRPAWMDDPSLLPKKPPGRAA